MRNVKECSLETDVSLGSLLDWSERPSEFDIDAYLGRLRLTTVVASQCLQSHVSAAVLPARGHFDPLRHRDVDI